MNPDKPVHARNVPTRTDGTNARGQLSHEQIAHRAEKLWHERSQPAGQDEAIWLEAEAQLKAEAESKPVAGTPSRPYTDEPAQPVRSKSKSRDQSDAAAQTRSATDGKSKQSSGKLRNQ
jgi:hypothetical protein